MTLKERAYDGTAIGQIGKSPADLRRALLENFSLIVAYGKRVSSHLMIKRTGMNIK